MEDSIIFPRSTSYRGLAVDAVAQAAFNEKKWVWVEDKEEGYIAAWISQEQGDQVQVHLNNGLVRACFCYCFRFECDVGAYVNVSTQKSINVVTIGIFTAPRHVNAMSCIRVWVWHFPSVRI